MLQYHRPAGGHSENRFIRKYIDSVEGMKKDLFSNRFLFLDSLRGPPTVMFSCHTDTVHGQNGMQKVFIDKVKGHMFAIDRHTLKKSILGADDAAGCWLMLEMIEAKIPGLYIFHQAEEVGGQGSQWIIDNTPELYNGITKAIAFDRKGRDEVITHQSDEQCASDEFATEICKALGLNYKLNPNGVFTDTANYMYTIPECTNISVGYENEHTNKEYLDYKHLLKLRNACLKVDWEGLGVHKDPTEPWELSKTYTDTMEYNDVLRLVENEPALVAEIMTQIYGVTHQDVREAEEYLNPISNVSGGKDWWQKVEESSEEFYYQSNWT